MNILVAEDEPVPAKLVEGILRKAAHTVTVVRTGVEALARLKAHPFDVLITDWMMPEMDGIELTRRVRAELRPSPIILMVTALGKAGEQHALSSGADGFLAKPVGATELLALLRQTQALRDQPQKPAAPTLRVPLRSALQQPPPFVAIAVAASTGGPDALRKLFQPLSALPDVAYFVVVHGPDWMQHSCAEVLQKENSALKFEVATHGVVAQPKCVYLAPGDRHLVVTPKSFTLALTNDPMVNFVRPAADPLFQSVASAFERFSIGVVLTGLGSDGAEGAAAIAAAGGKVFVQDPATATAPPMPAAAVRAVKHSTIVAIEQLGGSVQRTANGLGDDLRHARA